MRVKFDRTSCRLLVVFELLLISTFPIVFLVMSAFVDFRLTAPTNTNQCVQTHPKLLSSFRIHLQFKIELHFLFQIIDSGVKMLNHFFVVDFVGFSDCSHGFLRIK